MSASAIGDGDRASIRRVIEQLQGQAGQEAVVAALSDLLGQDRSGDRPAGPEGTPPFLTAATRASFTLEDLRATDTGADGPVDLAPSALSEVLDRSLVVPGQDPGQPVRYVLADDARQSVLNDKRGSVDLERALAAAAGSGDPETGYLKDFVTSWNAGAASRPPALDLASMKPPQVAAATRAAELVVGLWPAIQPAYGEMRRRLELEEVIAPLRILIGRDGPVGTGLGSDNFVGREEALLRLYEHVGVRPPETLAERARRAWQSLVEQVSGAPRGALVVHALGGMGKSALIAKFLLDHVRSDENWLLFAYLDFDRSTLAVPDPGALLLEIARQIGLQLDPQVIGEPFASQVQAVLSDFRARLRRDLPIGSTLLQTYADQLRAALDPLPGNRRILVVLDTVERLQAAGLDALAAVQDLFACFGLFRDPWPRLRVVACGRSDLAMLRADPGTPEPIALPRLSTGETAALARAMLRSLDPERPWTPDLIEAIAEAAQGYPLFVRALVSHLARASLGEDTDGLLRELRSTRGQAAKVATVLYTRFSDRVDLPGGPRTFKAALCLRTVTPSLLEAVLDGLGSGPGAEGVAAAFRKLCADETLWAERELDALRWRPDLRALLLGCITDEHGDGDGAFIRRVADIARHASPSRADELYYTLLAGQGLEAAEPLWQDAAAFRSALSEAALDFPSGSVEALYLRLLTSNRRPELADLVRLEPAIGWRLSWRSAPDLARLASSSVDPAIVKLIELSDEIAKPEPEFQARRFALLAKTGRWTEAEAALRADPTDRPVDRADLLNWLIRADPRPSAATRIPRLTGELARDPGRPRSRDRSGDDLVVAMVAARIAGDEALFARVDEQICELHARRLSPDNLLTNVILAGTFGERATEWAVDVAYQAKVLKVVSLAQLRLLGAACREAGLSGYPASRAIPADIDGPDRARTDDEAVGAMLEMLWLLRHEWDGQGRKAACLRAFFSIRNPDWLGPLGYAIANGFQQSLLAAVQQLVRQGRLDPELRKVFGASLTRNPINALRALDEAGALQVSLAGLKSDLERRRSVGGWPIERLRATLSPFRPSPTGREQMVALINRFERWQEKKRRGLGQP